MVSWKSITDLNSDSVAVEDLLWMVILMDHRWQSHNKVISGVNPGCGWVEQCWDKWCWSNAVAAGFVFWDRLLSLKSV